MQEEWKDVVGYEGLYKISNLGRAKRLYTSRPERILKPIKNQLGYMAYSFSKKSKIKMFRIHRLVAEYFISNPNNFPEVNHIDGNKENYTINNLEWCTRSHNMKHAHNMNLTCVRKAIDAISKLDSFKVEIIRKMKQRGFTLHEIATITDITISNISKIVNNQLWKPKENIR